MLPIILSLFILVKCQAHNHNEQFLQFTNLYRKNYNTREEYSYRLEQFQRNYNDVIEHDPEASGFVKELNQFADLSPEEYQQLLGLQADAQPTQFDFKSIITECFQGCISRVIHTGEQKAVPASVDWRLQGAVTPVKNQGQCGSCWSFSTTGAIESAYYIKNKQLISLSEQQFLDCDASQLGCNGGWVDKAFKYAAKNTLMTQSQYPYKAIKQKCKYNASAGLYTIKSFVDVTPKNTAALMQAVAQQPVSVGIDATNIQLYKSGIIAASSCGTNINHAVLVVGYGTQDGKDYWLVKNSWGTSWGEQGYFRIVRETLLQGVGACGILSQPAFPVL